jgi:hypothetical protein
MFYPPVTIYETWYEFKKDLEKRIGYCLLNWRWLRVKPKDPLPWNNSHMQTALSACARLEGGKAVQKRASSRELTRA